MAPSSSSTWRGRAAGTRWSALALTAVLALGTLSCADGASSSVRATGSTVAPTTSADQTTTTPPTMSTPIVGVPGMPPVIDPANIYSEAAAGKIGPNARAARFLVYVPNEASNSLTVIDPTTYSVVATYPMNQLPQHVVPSYDMTKLYVLNNSGNTLTPVDPLTGVPGTPFYVDDPYNLYFTPDGREAIVVAEAKRRLDFADPTTFTVHGSLQTDCDGINHIDFSADGRYFIATCEFDGRIIKVDTVQRKVVGELLLDVGASGRTNLIKRIAQPQDVRVANDGKVFYIADLITSGVFVIDGETFAQIGFVPTGVGAHGLYPSRDGRQLYVVNRGVEHIPAVGSYKGKATGSVSVIDFGSRQVMATWDMPGGGSPDMGNLTPDGRELWMGGRYDAEVYVFDTQQGKLTHRIPVGQNPHGLTVWPQPGRYSFGHTGNVR